MKTFKIRTDQGIKEVKGYKVEGLAVPAFAFKEKGGQWCVTELTTGAYLARGHLRKWAIAMAEDNINRIGVETTRRLIGGLVEDGGI